MIQSLRFYKLKLEEILKTPISYYGGKQSLSKQIVSMIPEHTQYVEPFVGGGAVFFEKPISKVEVINDKDGRVVNFFKMCKSQFEMLRVLIDQTPHSKRSHIEAEYVLKNQDLFSPVKIAWAFWVQCNMSYNSKMFSGFAYDFKYNSTAKKTYNARNRFTKEYAERLSKVQIECSDAIKVIEVRDSEETFFYCDPPYIETNCGHYAGYTLSDYVELLNSLSKIKGKFILSSFETDILDKFKINNNWNQKKFNLVSTASRNRIAKTEVLTFNFDYEE